MRITLNSNQIALAQPSKQGYWVDWHQLSFRLFKDDRSYYHFIPSNIKDHDLYGINDLTRSGRLTDFVIIMEEMND